LSYVGENKKHVMLRASYYNITFHFITIFSITNQLAVMCSKPTLTYCLFSKRKTELFWSGQQDDNGPTKENDQKEDNLSD